jgi:gamma-resorcylate decarboxylase
VWGEIRNGLVDVDKRLSEMDKYGIDKVIISHTNNGPQGEPDTAKATSLARETNDFIHDTYVSAHPDRFSAFAVLAVQDPAAAAQELRRTVDRGAKGALINGFSNIGNEDTAQYLDEEGLWGFWEVVHELGVPIYLHPANCCPTTAAESTRDTANWPAPLGDSPTKPVPTRSGS